MIVIKKWQYSLFFCILSVVIIPFLHFFFTVSFKFESSVWCLTRSNETKICKFKNICYDSQFKTLLFFLASSTVIKGFNNYTELQKIQLSSVQQHNQFYANLSVIDVKNFKLTQELILHSKVFLLSRFKPNNIMHSLHDDIFPLFLTLEHLCLGDLKCLESFTLVFHDNHPRGPFFYLYKLFSKDMPIVLNELNSNFVLCFEEVVTGLIPDGIFYQYGFKKPHGPIKTSQLVQNDVVRFSEFIKKKLEIKSDVEHSSKVLLFNRGKNRRILNVDEVANMVEGTYKRLNKKIEVNVLNLDLFSSDLKSLISTVSQSDGLIGMHGAEMILSLFLKPNSYVFEIFPFGIKPEVVSFIKGISELEGSHFKYFPWRNKLRNNSVTHPDAHPHFGGISHLDKVTQNKIRKVDEVPPFECCNNPIFLYYMYQDTLISDEFENYLYESLEQAFNHKMDSKLGLIVKNWFYPYTVYNISCGFQLVGRFLHVNWYPPVNVENTDDLWYSLYIQDSKELFRKDITTVETTVEVTVPDGVNPIFQLWISVYFKSNSFKSPDLYIKCY